MMEERSSQQPHSATLAVPIPSESDLAHLYKELSNQGKPALLSIVPQYCDKYVSYQTDDLSQPFSALFQPSLLKVSYTDLLSKCQELFGSLMITS